MIEQITMRELLVVPEFRKWMRQVPKITVVNSGVHWRLYVQMTQGGRWARADSKSYPKLYNAMKNKYAEAHDVVIHSKPMGFAPPIFKDFGKKFYMPSPEGHQWCIYCRRPTVFACFERHHAFPKQPIADYESRCSVCGGRSAGMPRYKTSVTWEMIVARANP